MVATEDSPGWDLRATTLRFGVTEAGKVILRGILFIALAALVIPVFDVLSVLVSVLLVGLIVGFIFRPRVLVTGSLSARMIAGQVEHVVYTIKNLRRLPAYHLRVRFRGLPDGIEQMADAQTAWRLGPGQTAQVVIALRPRRRGCYWIRRPVCDSSFPFNLFRFGVSGGAEESLIVLPAFSRLELSLPSVSRHVIASSARPAGRMGNSPEYIGNRPYQPGDPPRRIDVRAWARLAVPATKEYDNDLDSYAALVLDTRGLARGRNARATAHKSGAFARLRAGAGGARRRGPGGDGAAASSEELEAAVSLCASVAFTIHRTCLIDLLLAGADLHAYGSLPKAIRLDRVHETLAAVEPSDDYTADQIGPQFEDRLGEISEIIFILQRWDRTYQQLAERAEQAGCHCTIIVVGEPDRGAEDRRQETEGARQRIEDGTGATSPSFVVSRPSSDCRFISAGDILAGRRDVP